jgi:hypothetical protein
MKVEAKAEVKVQSGSGARSTSALTSTSTYRDFSSDLAGFVDRPISEVLDCALLDPSAGSPISP